MRINTVRLALSAMTVVVLGVVAIAQQKPIQKSAIATAITVYKTPT